MDNETLTETENLSASTKLIAVAITLASGVVGYKLAGIFRNSKVVETEITETN